MGFYQSQSTVTDQNEVLVSEYGGVTWAQATIVAQPSASTDGRGLSAVSRRDAADCVAVGHATGSGSGARADEILLSGDGGPPAVPREFEPAVAGCRVCPRRPDVRRRRVGQRLLPLSEPDPHERERATWTSVAVPEPAGATTQQLVGASRPTASACVAVGADDSQNEVLHTMGPAALTGVTLSAGVAGDLVILSGSGFGSAPGSVGFTPVARRRPSKSPHFGGSSSSPKRRVTDE